MFYAKAVSALLEQMGRGDCIFEDRIILDEKDAKLIMWCLGNAILSEEMLKKAIHRGICACGVRTIDEHLNRNPYRQALDHARSPHAVGYAYTYGDIVDEVVKKIRFDHGESIATYVSLSEDLPAKLLAQIQSAATPSQCTFMSSEMHDDFCYH